MIGRSLTATGYVNEEGQDIGHKWDLKNSAGSKASYTTRRFSVPNPLKGAGESFASFSLFFFFFVLLQAEQFARLVGRIEFKRMLQFSDFGYSSKSWQIKRFYHNCTLGHQKRGKYY
jgi:hypothetical protein